MRTRDAGVVPTESEEPGDHSQVLDPGHRGLDGRVLAGEADDLAHALGLGGGVDTSDTDLPAVIASYNGGEEAVRRWTPPDQPAPEADAWSEDVGYTETRQYIKRVLGFMMAYRYVYGDPP